MAKKRLYTLILFCVLANAIICSGALVCEFKDSCSGSETKVLGVSSLNNSHAELASYSNYDDVLCCRDDAGTYTIDTICGSEFLYLSSETNAHVSSDEVYADAACMGVSGEMDAACYYDTSCHAGKSCVLTLSDDDNAHIGECGEYSKQLCCGLANLPDYDDFFEPNTPTTDFEAVSDLSAVSDMVLADASGSQIRWNVPVDAEGEPYDTHVVVEDEFVSLNLSGLKESVNVNATVTVNVGGCDNWQIYYLNDSVDSWSEFLGHEDLMVVGDSENGCDTALPGDADPYCSNPSCVGYTLSYDVLHFDSTGAQGEGGPGGLGAIPEFSTIGIILAMLIIAMGVVVIRKRR